MCHKVGKFLGRAEGNGGRKRRKEKKCFKGENRNGSQFHESNKLSPLKAFLDNYQSTRENPWRFDHGSKGA